MDITNIDHIVFTVNDIGKSVEFYETVLGMVSETFGEERVALKFGNKKINLHEKGKKLKPNAKKAIPGSQDLCFITSTKIDTAMAHVKNKGIKIIEGPVKRTGAIGAIISFYFRDPDDNLIEVASYE